MRILKNRYLTYSTLSYIGFLISLLFLPSCAASLNETKLEGNENIRDSSTDVLLITNDEEKFPINWGVYEEENGFFSIRYPQDWSIEPPVDLDSESIVNSWQFRGEQTSPHSIQGVTLGRYAIPTISDDISLESWLELIGNNEFDFERLRMESTEVDGRDTYIIHNRYSLPERDAYVTYMRCQNRVWSLQAADVDLESTTIEEIYESMRDSLALSCGE